MDIYISQNIRHLRKSVPGLSQKKLADLLDVTDSAVSGWEKGTSFPATKVLVKLARYFAVTVDDLLTKDLTKTERKEKESAFKPDYKPLGPSHNMLVPASAYAGYALEWSQETPESAHFIEVPGITGEARTFEVDGDSMEPVLYDGDFLSCKPVEKAINIKNGYLYCIVSKSTGPQIKYVQLGRTSLKMIPANRGYQTYEIDLDDVMEVWEGVVRITRHLVDPRGLSTYVDPDRIRRIEQFIGQVHPDFGKG